MKPKLCKYKYCNKEAINFPNSTIKQKYCQEHAIKVAIELSHKKAKKESIQRTKKQKELIKSKSYFEKLLQTEINSIVRLIDNDKGCISCDHGWTKEATRQWHAGHRLSVGSNPTLRFNLFNIYKQCSICNNWKSANEREYDKGIVNNYGIELLEYIKQLPDEFKELHLSIDELKTAIEKARKVKKEILSGIDYTRHEINEKIGIYGRSN